MARVNPNPNLMLQAARVLSSLNVRWMLTGSFATNLYTVPRFTADADFVVELDQVSTVEIARRLEGFRLDDQMSFETNTSTIRHVLRHENEPFTVELFELSRDAHDRERFQRRQCIDYSGYEMYVPTAEDVIVQKFRWFPMTRRPKDLDDARNVVESMFTRLDWPYIESWCDRHGTRDLLEQIRAETHPPQHPAPQSRTDETSGAAGSPDRPDPAADSA